MGNANSARVLGMGTVELQFTCGRKLTLINVHLVPEIRKNIVPQTCYEKGVKATLECDKLILLNMMFLLGKVIYVTRIFRLSIIKIIASVYMLSLFLWHDCLTNLNYKSVNT